MQWWILALGVALLLLLAIDLLWTVLWVERGQGPITSRVTSWIWRGLKRAFPRRHAILGLAGPATTVVTILVWVLLLWGGWTLVFLSAPEALRHTRDATPPDAVGVVYFVAYTLFTMGNGDFTPVGDAAQLATALTTANGMLFVTLFISYIISITGAVVAKRSFANQVHGLGDSPADILVRAWDGRGFPSLDLQVESLNTQLGTVTEQHLTFPILHYYHPVTRSKSSALAIAKLDEALTLMAHAVRPEVRLAPGLLKAARSGTRTYLETLQTAFIDAAPDAPDAPSLDPLRSAGIPVADERAFREALQEEARRRRLLLAAVTGDAWAWEDVAARRPHDE